MHVWMSFKKKKLKVDEEGGGLCEEQVSAIQKEKLEAQPFFVKFDGKQPQQHDNLGFPMS